MATTFLITAEGARAFATREAAEGASGTGGHLVDSADALSATPLTGTELVALHNALPGVTPVRKFTDRTTAARRIFAALQTVPVEAAAEPAPVAHNGPTEGATPAPRHKTRRRR